MARIAGESHICRTLACVELSSCRNGQWGAGVMNLCKSHDVDMPASAGARASVVPCPGVLPRALARALAGSSVARGGVRAGSRNLQPRGLPLAWKVQDSSGARDGESVTPPHTR